MSHSTPQTIPSLFRASVERFGDRPAVCGESVDWTYAELAERVWGLARRMRELGVASGDRVAILEFNRPSYLIAYFAAAWIGAVLQPLNHRLSARELQVLLDDAEAGLLLFSPEFEALAQELTGVERVSADTSARSPEVPMAAVRAEDLAHLYYTSGTTGRAKGVMLTHGNVCAHAACVIEELDLVAEDRWGHFAPLFHLADAWATFAITAVGGVHVMHAKFAAGEALEAIERERVTLTNLVPTMLTMMVADPAIEGFDPSSLRTILSGGAPITKALVRRIESTFRCEYIQTYGMTETSPYLTLGILHEHLRELPDEERLHFASRTGRPFAAVDLEVVDEEGHGVPADDATVGEIRVRGATVSPGYWRLPEETAAAHRDGWLYTGDLAVLDGEGYVNIVDRKKDMILTGGENVYSTEVESVLAEHPAILTSAVYGTPDETWGERVCAAVVLGRGESIEVEELLAWCRERLAAFKTPRTVHFLDRLPTTGSGKVSKQELRRLARQSGGTDPRG